MAASDVSTSLKSLAFKWPTFFSLPRSRFRQIAWTVERTSASISYLPRYTKLAPNFEKQIYLQRSANRNLSKNGFFLIYLFTAGEGGGGWKNLIEIKSLKIFAEKSSWDVFAVGKYSLEHQFQTSFSLFLSFSFCLTFLSFSSPHFYLCFNLIQCHVGRVHFQCSCSCFYFFLCFVLTLPCCLFFT